MRGIISSSRYDNGGGYYLYHVSDEDGNVIRVGMRENELECDD
jgi:hypothetical protein